MKRWQFIAVEVTLLVVMFSGIGIADELHTPWLQAVAISIGVIGTGLLTMAWKRHRQRATFSAEPDSIEASQDQSARASAFIDVLLITAAALALTTFWDTLPAPVVLFVQLALFAAAYWMRRALLAGR